MSDFEISGLHSLKQQLTLMSRQPRAVRSHNPIAERLIDEIYPELRQAKIAGYSWKDLSALISDKCKIKLSANTASKLFRILDLRYEKETGVKALPVAKKYGGRKKAQPTGAEPESEAKTFEEIGAPVSTYTGKKRGRPKKKLHLEGK